MRSSFIATIARDPELKISAKGTPFMNVSVWEYTGEKEQGSSKKETQFLDLTLFGKQAEGLHPYMTKGKQFVFHVEGIKPKSYERKDGSLSISIQAKVVGVDFVNSQSDTQQQSQPRQQANAATTVADLDDDIPF